MTIKRYAMPYPLVLAGFLFILPGVAAPRTTQITQWRINEFAAYCLDARLALKGLKGEPLPGETPAEYRRRVSSYLTALHELCKRLTPLRTLPSLKDQSPSNDLVWNRIRAHTMRLPAELAAVEHVWHNGTPIGPPSALGSKLLTALDTVMALLNDLRNARP